MKISVGIKMLDYTGGYSQFNTIGNRYDIEYINVLDLYRHALANTSYELFSSANIRRYGWSTIYRHGIEKSFSYIDNIFAIHASQGVFFLKNDDYHKFSKDNFECVKNKKLDGKKFLMDLCAEQHGPNEIGNDVTPKLIRNPLSFFEIGDATRDNSYHTGMIFSRLYAEKILNIPFLTHLSDLKKKYTIVPQKGLEPDLVGLDQYSNWHAFEAKGTTNNSYLYSGLSKAKKQLRSLKSINGELNIVRTASGTLYNEKYVRTLMRDPEPTGEAEITIDMLSAILSHYKYININSRFMNDIINNQKNTDFVNLPYLEFPRIPFRFLLHKDVFKVLYEARSISRKHPLDYKLNIKGANNEYFLYERMLLRNRLCASLVTDLHEISDYISLNTNVDESYYSNSSVGLDGFRLEYQHKI